MEVGTGFTMTTALYAKSELRVAPDSPTPADVRSPVPSQVPVVNPVEETLVGPRHTAAGTRMVHPALGLRKRRGASVDTERRRCGRARKRARCSQPRSESRTGKGAEIGAYPGTHSPKTLMNTTPPHDLCTQVLGGAPGTRAQRFVIT